MAVTLDLSAEAQARLRADAIRRLGTLVRKPRYFHCAVAHAAAFDGDVHFGVSRYLIGGFYRTDLFKVHFLLCELNIVWMPFEAISNLGRDHFRKFFDIAIVHFR